MQEALTGIRTWGPTERPRPAETVRPTPGWSTGFGPHPLMMMRQGMRTALGFPEEDGFDGPVTAPPKDPIPGVFASASAGEDDESRTGRAPADAPAPGADHADAETLRPKRRRHRWFRRIMRRPGGSSPYRIRLPWARRQVILALSILVGLVVLAVGLLGSLDPVGEDAAAPPRPPALDPTPGGEVQRGSIEYQEVLREANDSGASAALSSEGTFLPTPEALPEPLVEALGDGATPEAAGDPFNFRRLRHDGHLGGCPGGCG